MKFSPAKKLILLALTIQFLVSNTSAATDLTPSIPIATYYDYPPFLIDKEGNGLNKDLAHYLTLKSNGKYHFNSVYIPKGRLDKMLDSKWPGIIAWPNPRFVRDEEMKKYIWSKAIMHEIDYVASLKSRPVEYVDHKSLYGLTLARVLNHRFADIEDALNSGKIKQATAKGPHSVVPMLLKGRVDVAFISKSTISWLKKDFPEFDTKIHLAKIPRIEFDRHLLLTPALNPEITQFVLKVINEMGDDPSWNQKLGK